MKKIAFLYPGQGSQAIGMGKDLYESSQIARDMYDKVDTSLGNELKSSSFEGPDEKLKQTYITQPALFVQSAVLTVLLAEKGLKPNLAAGHSLGEYSALFSAQAADFEQLFELVRVRGELMQNAGEISPGTMAALIGPDPEKVVEICAKAESAGVVKPANFNAPGQVVISGSIDGVHRAMEIAKEEGVRRVVELNVSGAFHSPLMAHATEGLVSKIEETDWNQPVVPVVANVTAKEMTEVTDIKENLKLQLLSPVLWSDSISNMANNGIEAFVEVGSGKVLAGLVKRIAKDIPCYSVGTVEDIDTIEEKLGL